MTINHQTHINDIPETLRKIKSTSDPNDYCKNAIRYLEIQKTKINDWLRYYNFPTEEEEIHYFKVLKPQLTSKIIYYKKRHEIDIKLPISQKAKYKYYDRQLEKNNQAISDFKSFSRYIRNESTHRDQEYFLRKNNNSDLNDQYQFAFLDEKTTTKMEFLLATLLAKEQIIFYLESKLDEIEQQCKNTKLISNLKWTGSKIEIIELIYAIHHQKVINNGNADIKELANGIEKLLNIEISPYLYRTYQDIKQRKTGHTKFLNSLSENLKTCIFAEEF